MTKNKTHCKTAFLDRHSTLRDLDTGMPVGDPRRYRICLLDRRDYYIHTSTAAHPPVSTPDQSTTQNQKRGRIFLSPVHAFVHDRHESSVPAGIYPGNREECTSPLFPGRACKRGFRSGLRPDKSNRGTTTCIMQKETLNRYRQHARGLRLLPAYLTIPQRFAASSGSVAIIMAYSERVEVMEFSGGYFTTSRTLPPEALPFAGISENRDLRIIVVNSELSRRLLPLLGREAACVTTISAADLVVGFQKAPYCHDLRLLVVIGVTAVIGAAMLYSLFAESCSRFMGSVQQEPEKPEAPAQVITPMRLDRDTDPPQHLREDPDANPSMADQEEADAVESLEQGLSAWVQFHPQGAAAETITYRNKKISMVIRGTGLFTAAEIAKSAGFFDRYILDGLSMQDKIESLSISWSPFTSRHSDTAEAAGAPAGSSIKSPFPGAATVLSKEMLRSGVEAHAISTGPDDSGTVSAAGSGSPGACAAFLHALDRLQPGRAYIELFTVQGGENGLLRIDVRLALPVAGGLPEHESEETISEAASGIAIVLPRHDTDGNEEGPELAELLERIFPATPQISEPQPPVTRRMAHVATIRTAKTAWFFFNDSYRGVLLALPETGEEQNGWRVSNVSDRHILLEGDGALFRAERKDR